VRIHAIAVFILFVAFGPTGGLVAQTTQPTTPTTAAADDIDAISPQEAALLQKLEKHTPHDLRFDAVPFEKVINQFQDLSGATIQVDWTALESAGIKRDAPVTARLHDIKISKALELVLKSVEGEDDDKKLGYRTLTGVIKISTKKELDKLLVDRTYDVNDLIAKVEVTRGKTGTTEPAPIVSDSPFRQSPSDVVVKFITDNVDPTSWDLNGGDVGTISFDATNKRLKTKQTPENQRAVRKLIEYMRKDEDWPKDQGTPSFNDFILTTPQKAKPTTQP
jgi:hypothetical protein